MIPRADHPRWLEHAAWWLLLVTLAVVGSIILAREEADGAPSGIIVRLLDPEERCTSRIVLLVDVSGSMQDAGLVPAALGAIGQIAGAPVDQAEVLVYGFSQDPMRCPEGWIKLPDADAVARVDAWVAAQKGGATRLAPALVAGLGEKRSDLTVVIISDGIFPQEKTADIVVSLKLAQSKRIQAGLGRAVVGCWGVGHSTPDADLLAVARAGRGGYVGQSRVRSRCP